MVCKYCKTKHHFWLLFTVMSHITYYQAWAHLAWASGLISPPWRLLLMRSFLTCSGVGGVGVGLLPALSQLTRPPLHALLHPFPPNRSPCFPSATRLLALPLLSCPRAAAVPHSCCFPEPPGYVLLPSWSLSFSKGSPGIRGLLNQSHKGQRVCHTAVTPESHTDCSFCLPQ